MGSRPKAPEPSPEELALEKRTLMGLQQERAATERMLKAQARSKLGVKSLLGGIKPDTGMKQEDVVHSKAPGSVEKTKKKSKKSGLEETYSKSILGSIL
jgi:hypothetical protein